ncbi:hypothetical protein [Leifsonia aquatica]|uniref:hypothetical protein n=1 Tax=Leifsonia aquatica TaxID=144185 RepID=UPI0038145687
MRFTDPLVGSLVEYDHYFGEIDERSFQAMTVAWALAARSPRSIIFVPATKSAEPIETVDLVLVHHSLQLKPSNWKRLRSALGRGRPTRIQLPAEAFDPPGLHPDGYRASALFREDKDKLHYATAARTMFVTGSRVAFEDHLPQLLDVAETGYGRPGEQVWADVCVEIGWPRLQFHVHALPWPPGE